MKEWGNWTRAKYEKWLRDTAKGLYLEYDHYRSKSKAEYAFQQFSHMKGRQAVLRREKSGWSIYLPVECIRLVDMIRFVRLYELY